MYSNENNQIGNYYELRVLLKDTSSPWKHRHHLLYYEFEGIAHISKVARLHMSKMTKN